MTSRDRVLSTIAHHEPDRLPRDCGAMRSTGIMGIAYDRMKTYLGVTGGHTRIFDAVQQLAIPEEWYLDRFGLDAVDLSRAFAENDDDWVEWTLQDGTQVQFPAWLQFEPLAGGGWACLNDDGVAIAQMPASATYFSQKVFPLMGQLPESFESLGKWMNMSPWSYMTDPIWKNTSRSDFWTYFGETAKKYRSTTDRAIMLGFGGNLFEWGQFLYRTDEFLINLLTEPETMERLLDALVERHLHVLDQVLEAVGSAIDIIQFGDDLGTQAAPMIDPELYHRMFFPRHKRLFERVHQHGIKVFFHSCGAIADFMPDLIDAGADILNPVQIGAVGMDPVRLKNEFGKDVCFWGGGIDTQHVLALSTPQEVKDAVRRNCEVFAKDGGFVFNQVHNILANVPPENVVAMYEAASEF
jgi:uroporphyrinogen decarboxylase